MLSYRISPRFALLGLLAGPGSAPVLAQAPAAAAVAPTSRAYETRAQLESAAAAADKRGSKSEAWLLRSRLEKGDFQEGDRIIIALENNPKSDTVQVRAGKLVQLVGMADLSLDGVLRSELNDAVSVHLAKYLKAPGVRTTPLLVITMLGTVGTPGYYYVPADVVLRDVLMRAGIPGTADLDRITIRRNGETIWKAADVRVALTDGLSIDRLHLRAGDEIFVPAKRTGFAVGTVLSAISATAGVFFMVTQLMR